MNEPQKTNWKRLGIEAAAIVGSILLAFSIDAWWDERQVKVDENLLLKSLLSELKALEAAQAQLNAYNAAVKASAEKLLILALKDEIDVSKDDIDKLLADITWQMNPVFVRSPELDSLASGGNLWQISNVELRQSIVVFKHDLDIYRLAMRRDREFYANSQLPFMEERSNLVQIGNADDGRPGGNITPYLFEKFTIDTQMDHQELLKNPVFKNILMQRIWALTDILTWRPPNFEERLGDIVTLIEQEFQT